VAWVTMIDDGMLFHWYWKFLNNYFDKYPYLVKPLGYCSVCFMGQVSFWFYLFAFDVNIVKHIIFVLVVIAMVSLLNYLIGCLIKN
jgi:hypothetical protein